MGCPCSRFRPQPVQNLAQPSIQHNQTSAVQSGAQDTSPSSEAMIINELPIRVQEVREITKTEYFGADELNEVEGESAMKDRRDVATMIAEFRQSLHQSSHQQQNPIQGVIPQFEAFKQQSPFAMWQEQQLSLYSEARSALPVSSDWVRLAAQPLFASDFFSEATNHIQEVFLFELPYVDLVEDLLMKVRDSVFRFWLYLSPSHHKHVATWIRWSHFRPSSLAKCPVDVIPFFSQSLPQLAITNFLVRSPGPSLALICPDSGWCQTLSQKNWIDLLRMLLNNHSQSIAVLFCSDDFLTKCFSESQRPAWFNLALDKTKNLLPDVTNAVIVRVEYLVS